MTRRRQGSTKTRTSRFGIYLDTTTHKQLLQAALDQSTSATALVEQLIKRYLAGRPRRRTGKS